MTFKVKHFNPNSSGELYMQTNVPIDYDTEKLDSTFDKMKFNFTKNSYDYRTGNIDSNQHPVKKEFEHIYKVFHSYNAAIENLVEFNPYEWCIVESDSVLTEEALTNIGIDNFKDTKKRIEMGEVNLFTVKIK